MSVRLRRAASNKPKRQKQPPMPLPEAIRPGPWKIEESQHRRSGETQLELVTGGKLTIPLGGGEIERALRLHEQTHIAISPRDPTAWDGVDQTVLNLCEDRRVHHAMELSGFQEQLDAMGGLKEDMSIEWQRLADDYRKADNARDKAGRSLKLIPPRAVVAARVMACYGTGLFESQWRAAKILDEVAADVGLSLAEQFEGSKIHPFAEAKAAAELLCEMFGTPNEPDTSGEGETKKESVLSPYAAKTPRLLEALARIKGGEPATDIPGGGYIEGEAWAWPEMEIIEKARPLRLAAKMRGGFRKLPDTRGRSLRHVARLAQDGRVFRNKHHVRRRGGAVLIDCSGSMSLSADDVEAIMIALPAAVIATYSGSGSYGELWVVARDGRRAITDDLHPDMMGNVVDVPALEWLNKQRGPRYWICDGAVTEHGDEGTARVIAACYLLAKQGEVIRVGNVSGVLAQEGWERVGKEGL